MRKFTVDWVNDYEWRVKGGLAIVRRVYSYNQIPFFHINEDEDRESFELNGYSAHAAIESAFNKDYSDCYIIRVNQRPVGVAGVTQLTDGLFRGLRTWSPWFLQSEDCPASAVDFQGIATVLLKEWEKKANSFVQVIRPWNTKTKKWLTRHLGFVVLGETKSVRTGSAAVILYRNKSTLDTRAERWRGEPLGAKEVTKECAQTQEQA